MSLVLGSGLEPVGHRGWRETCRGVQEAAVGTCRRSTRPGCGEAGHAGRACRARRG